MSTVELDEIIDCHEAHAGDNCWDEPKCCHAVIAELREAVQHALALHTPIRIDHAGSERCSHCVPTTGPVAWPCPTVEALTRCGRTCPGTTIRCEKAPKGHRLPHRHHDPETGCTTTWGDPKP